MYSSYMFIYAYIDIYDDIYVSYVYSAACTAYTLLALQYVYFFFQYTQAWVNRPTFSRSPPSRAADPCLPLSCCSCCNPN